jgi:hypothetical protein
MLEPLRQPREFRLLALEESKDQSNETIVRVNIQNYQIHCAPHYTALSYVWGDPTRTVLIDSNIGSLLITTNLHAALLRLLGRAQETLFWIDAISINQNDDAEKSHQLPLMREIYAGAECVLVWLGEADESSPALYEVIRIFEDHWFWNSRILDTYNHDSLCEVQKLVDQLLARPYFQRIWTVQELVIAQNAEIICSEFSANLHDFFLPIFELSQMGFVLNLDRYEPYETIKNWGLHHIAHAALGAAGEICKNEWPLTYLLDMYRQRQATDPKDKVLALIGIAEDAHNFDLNYTEPTEVIYLKTCKRLIATHKDLRVLSQVLGRSSIINIPSWVPDWSTPVTGITLACQERRGRRGFKAAGDTITSLRDVKDADILLLRGFKLSKIKLRGDFALELVKWMNIHGDLTFKGIRDLIKNNLHGPVATNFENTYPFTGEGYTDAYVRTLAADSLSFYEDWELLRLYNRWVKERNSSSDRRIFQYWQWIQTGITVEEIPWYIDEEILFHIIGLLTGRDLFVTEDGQMGIGPSDIRIGDWVCILYGGDVPYVLRPQGKVEYKFIGESYVHGFMNGEALGKITEESLEDFSIR